MKRNRAVQEPPEACLAEELETPPHICGGCPGVRERCEIGVDAPVGVEYGGDLARVVHRRADLCLVPNDAGVVFYANAGALLERLGHSDVHGKAVIRT